LGHSGHYLWLPSEYLQIVVAIKHSNLELIMTLIDSTNFSCLDYSHIMDDEYD